MGDGAVPWKIGGRSAILLSVPKLTDLLDRWRRPTAVVFIEDAAGFWTPHAAVPLHVLR